MARFEKITAICLTEIDDVVVRELRTYVVSTTNTEKEIQNIKDRLSKDPTVLDVQFIEAK